MKLSRKLELQLNRLFVASGTVGLVALILSTYLSTVAIKDKAVNFITSHVKQISLAEIGSQNVSEIDREVHRLYETWRDTQDLDIRVDVFLDGKLVSHAGQLQKFGLLSFSAENLHHLPSGQLLSISIEMDLTGQIFYDLAILIVFATFVFACFVALRRNLGRVINSVTSPLEDRISWITAKAAQLPSSLKGEVTFETTDIEELNALDLSLVAFTQQILKLEDDVANRSFNEGRVKMADQLAHNIRGTIATLKLRIENSKGLSKLEKEKLLASIGDITNVTRSLLEARRHDSLSVNESGKQELDILQSIQEVLDEKLETLGVDTGIGLSLVNNLAKPCIVLGNNVDFKAAFRNLIDNSEEAIETTGNIVVTVTTENGLVELTVTDSGRGIPEHIIPLLMKDGNTFGKPNGNGIGLSHANSTIQSMGGQIEIKSTVSVGTTVSVKIPVIETNQTDTIIELLPGHEIIILDDLPLIHEAYRIKLNRLGSVKITNLYSSKEFNEWIRTNGAGDLGNRLYLMDCDLGKGQETGLDLISKYGLQFESFLITGLANDIELQKIVKEKRIRMISKDQIPNLRFRLLTSPDAQNNCFGEQDITKGVSL